MYSAPPQHIASVRQGCGVGAGTATAGGFQRHASRPGCRARHCWRHAGACTLLKPSLDPRKQPPETPCSQIRLIIAPRLQGSYSPKPDTVIYQHPSAGLQVAPTLQPLRLPDAAMSLPPVALPGAGAAAPLAGDAGTPRASMRRSASHLRLPDNAPPVRVPSVRYLNLVPCVISCAIGLW